MTATNNKFIAFVESFSGSFPHEVNAIKQAYTVCCESDMPSNTSDNKEPVIPDASPEQLEKFKQAVDTIVPKQIEAKKVLQKTNQDLDVVKKSIEDETKKNAQTA